MRLASPSPSVHRSVVAQRRRYDLLEAEAFVRALRARFDEACSAQAPLLVLYGEGLDEPIEALIPT